MIFCELLKIKSSRTWCISASLMSKSKKSKESRKNVVEKEVPHICSSITEDKSGNILMKILAKPGAKLNSITEIGESGIGVQINAPPLEGEANTELVRYMSEVLGIRKSDISLEKGSRSRQKIIMISKGVLTMSDVHTKLNEVISDR